MHDLQLATLKGILIPPQYVDENGFAAVTATINTRTSNLPLLLCRVTPLNSLAPTGFRRSLETCCKFALS